jgi:hypothetical protein
MDNAEIKHILISASSIGPDVRGTNVSRTQCELVGIHVFDCCVHASNGRMTRVPRTSNARDVAYVARTQCKSAFSLQGPSSTFNCPTYMQLRLQVA